MHMLAVIALSLGGADLAPSWLDRRFVIYSDPPGAQVFRNGVLIGNTPVDDHFIYYGKYQFTLVRDKCQTLQVVENISSPWYDLPGIDFFSENLLPYKLRDVRYLYYRLEPLQPVNQELLVKRAEELKARGDTIGTPALRATLPPPAPPPSQILVQPGSMPGRVAPNPYPPAMAGPSPLPSPGGGIAPPGVGSVPPGGRMRPPLQGTPPPGQGSTFVPSNPPPMGVYPITIPPGSAPPQPGSTFVPSGGNVSPPSVGLYTPQLQATQPGVAPR